MTASYSAMSLYYYLRPTTMDCKELSLKVGVEEQKQTGTKPL